MRGTELSFLVVGAGAVGGVTAALLKKNGINVEIVCRNEEYASAVNSEGLYLSGTCGNFNVNISAYSSVSQVRDKKDIILLATKANDMLDAATDCLKIMSENSYLVSLQNGICENAISEVVGTERVIGCVTGWGATMDSHGRFEMTSTGDFILGYPHRQTDEYLKSLASVLSNIVPAETTDNIFGHLYSKLIINSCITSMGAVCGMYLGAMLAKRKARRIFIGIIREAVDVADSLNVRIEVFAGKLDFRKFLEGNGIVSDVKRHITLLIIGFKYRKLKSSSLQSILRGKRTEINYLNGYIVENGNINKISVPVNTMIVNMIHEIEEGKREITEKNFNDPFFDRFNF
jgi:2-dehydropantoate 2-reductase